MQAIGQYMVDKYRSQVAPVFNTDRPGSGCKVAARLRKQGFSLDAALMILVGSNERGKRSSAAQERYKFPIGYEGAMLPRDAVLINSFELYDGASKVMVELDRLQATVVRALCNRWRYAR